MDKIITISLLSSTIFFQDKIKDTESPLAATERDLETEKNNLEAEWEPHRKVSSVEQSTFTVERKLNVEIDMTGQEDKKEWSIHYVTEEDDTEKKDVGRRKLKIKRFFVC